MRSTLVRLCRPWYEQAFNCTFPFPFLFAHELNHRLDTGIVIYNRNWSDFLLAMSFVQAGLTCGILERTVEQMHVGSVLYYPCQARKLSAFTARFTRHKCSLAKLNGAVNVSLLEECSLVTVRSQSTLFLVECVASAAVTSKA